jgi:hypothetical protein
MIHFFALIFLLSPLAQAYTFNNNFESAFKNKNVSVSIDDQTNCDNAEITIYDLEDMIPLAVDKFWNRVPTSKLRLKFGGFSKTTTNINDGLLCAPTDTTCIENADADVIAPVMDIIIACNSNPLNFGGSNVLAVTIPNHFSGKNIVGAVILINNNSTIFSTLNRADQIGVIAHEIGHAIGLGHTSDTSALMYYKTVDQRSALGSDDIRGVSYLYPMQIDGFGLLGGCATIQANDGNPGAKSPFWQMGASLAVMILLVELRKLLKRSQARAAT